MSSSSSSSPGAFHLSCSPETDAPLSSPRALVRLLLGDSVTSFDYLMEKEALLNVDDAAHLVVDKVDGGVNSVSLSPDGELVAVTTGRENFLPVSWRGDGKYFATTSYLCASGPLLKKIKVWERDSGKLLASSELKAFSGVVLEWMPSGAKITVVYDEKLSDLLAGIVECEDYDVVKIWYFSNNHWYLKYEIRYLKQGEVRIMNPRKPHNLICWTAGGQDTVYNFVWITAVTKNSIALVIDGSNIHVTPLSLSLMRPPMYLFSLKFSSCVRGCTCWMHAVIVSLHSVKISSEYMIVHEKFHSDFHIKTSLKSFVERD
ncbi:hypothetical protein RJT34_17673 [Clitoria ternatea]|uniref:Elongator complex protein 1 n=1 Tax=Clitoria ternatea TaxID=43366 RepID=A0AAN9J9D8_CLITE